MLLQTDIESITPSDNDTKLAQTSSEALARVLNGSSLREDNIRFNATTDPGTEILLPTSAVRLLFAALQEMAKGHTVALLPVDAELTTQQAADILRVSRPSIIKMLDQKKLPYRKVGAHRRIRYEDVQTYLKAERARRHEVMQQLVAETEQLGLYK